MAGLVHPSEPRSPCQVADEANRGLSPPGGNMTTYSFTVILAGVNVITDEMANALYEAGCDDSTPGSRNGVVMVGFDREAENLGAAIGSAVEDVVRAGYKVARVEIEEPAAVG